MTLPEKSEVDFGFRKVAPKEKTRLVGEVFSSVASKYDLMNDLMSLGIHRLWKRHFVASSGVHSGDHVLDLAGGTGDIAALLAARVGSSGKVVIGDINAEMLSAGRDRLTDRGLVSNLSYVRLNAETLPFPENSFHAVTIAFGLRNVTDMKSALVEMRRVLKPGGKAMILEFSEVQEPLLKPLYDIHSFQILPRLGRVFANDADSYRYLAESIRKHPNQQTLKQLMLDSGFDRVDYRNLSAGIVAIHSGVKA